MKFPKETFDLISARHTIINAKQIYNCLKPGGVLVIEGIDKADCIEIKDMFGRGQAYLDEISISEIDYKDLKNAGFENIEKVKIYEDEYYETEEDLLALLLKTPILDDFSEIKNEDFEHKEIIEKDGRPAISIKWTSPYSGQFDIWFGDDFGPLFDYKKTIVVESLF